MRTILIPAINHTKQAMRSNVRFLTIGGPPSLNVWKMKLIHVE